MPLPPSGRGKAGMGANTRHPRSLYFRGFAVIVYNGLVRYGLCNLGGTLWQNH
ncbi:MAG: hypothetical protein BWY52_00946 [Chloroflexi bacterium ADurb.Bin325]|nr:MAG: hypothetical protein BWY52_00946 [Chloroflexi bacterium ADurb.Bin325]